MGKRSSIGSKDALPAEVEAPAPAPAPPESTTEKQRKNSWEQEGRERDIRQGIDLATTLERIEKNFVITDPRLPDNPIVSTESRHSCSASSGSYSAWKMLGPCRSSRRIASWS
jgi:hypothetical protein